MKSKPVASAGRSASNDASDREIDAGLRHHVLAVYGYMVAGLALSGFVAGVAAELRLTALLLGMPILFGGIVASPFFLALLVGRRTDGMRSGAAHLAFWSYSALLGLSLSALFAALLEEDTARTFFLAAATFLAVFVHGYATRCDVTGLDAFLGMGTAGIVIASLAGIVLESSPTQLAISLAGVVAIVALAARDASHMRESHAGAGSAAPVREAAIQGALALYTGFISLPTLPRRRS